MSKYHKVTINGEIFFREFDTVRGYYENEMLSQEELIELLLEEVVESEIEIDETEIERAINCIPNLFQREVVKKYVTYLEAVVVMINNKVGGYYEGISVYVSLHLQPMYNQADH